MFLRITRGQISLKKTDDLHFRSGLPEKISACFNLYIDFNRCDLQTGSFDFDFDFFNRYDIHYSNRVIFMYFSCYQVFSLGTVNWYHSWTSVLIMAVIPLTRSLVFCIYFSFEYLDVE